MEGVRARTLTVWHALRQLVRTERLVPPVAPKIATVAFGEVEVNFFWMG